MICQTLAPYLFISAALFSIGVYGLLCRRNLVAILICLELILNSASINFLAFNRFTIHDKSVGQIFVIFIIALAAAEVSIGLSLVLCLFRKKGSINIEEMKELEG